MHTTTLIAPATGLAAELERQGWTRGVPEHIADATAAVDRRICRFRRCPCCRRRGLFYRPFNKARRYRVVAQCECGHAEELETVAVTRQPPDPTEALFRAVAAWVNRYYPSDEAVRLRIELRIAGDVRLPVPTSAQLDYHNRVKETEG